MPRDHDRLFIDLPARAENVAVVRQAVGGLAEREGMKEPDIGDLKTVVTEACANVVIHAYPNSSEGPLEVEAFREGQDLAVVVRDRGTGIHLLAGREDSLRLGLALISTLASGVQVSARAGGGTEVSMRLLLPGESSESELKA